MRNTCLIYIFIAVLILRCWTQTKNDLKRCLCVFLCVCSALMYAVRVVVLCQLYALLAQTVGNPYINKSMWSCEMLGTDDYHRHRDVMPHNPASTLTGLPAHSKVQIQKAMPSSS